MSMKNTIILFFALVVLGGYVYLVEIKKHQADQEIEETSKKVFNVEKDSIDYLSIKNSNGQFVLKKSQNEWRIVEPLNTGTDESTLNSMLNNLSSTNKENEFSVDPSELSDYGLGDWAIAVHYQIKDERSDSVRFGDKTPVGAYVFATINDSTVFTTNEYIKNSYDKKLFDIRDKKLLHFNRNNVRRMIMRTSYGTYEFEKNDQSNWDISTIKRPADDTKLSSILNKLGNNNIKEFVDEEGNRLKEFSLDKPKYEIELQLTTEEGKRTLSISKKIDNKYYAKDSDRKPIFVPDSNLVNEMNKKITEFRDPDLVDFETNEINRLKIEYNDTLITANKDTAGNWSVEGYETREVKSGNINSFLSDLKYSRISEFIKDGKYEPAVYGFDQPSLKISMFKENQFYIEVTLGNKKDEKIFATTNVYDSVYLIIASKLKDLKLKLDDILEPELEELNYQIDSLTTSE
jgi:hypothetical protein